MKKLIILMQVLLLITFVACEDTSMIESSNESTVISSSIQEQVPDVKVELNGDEVKVSTTIKDNEVYVNASELCKVLGVEYYDFVEKYNSIDIITDADMLHFEFEITEETAIKIADTVLDQIVGEGHSNGTIVEVTYLEDLKQYKVRRYNDDEFTQGGVTTVVINKTDGRIVRVTMTE